MSKNKKKILFPLTILILLAGGCFYFWYSWLPSEIEKEASTAQIFQETESPALFNKNGYQIEEKAGQQYIVIEKLGFSCKVPTGWKAEFKENNMQPPGHWINLLSPDAEISSGLLIKGCGISIVAESAQRNNQDTRNEIDLIKNSPEKSDEIRENYEFELIKVEDNEGLKWIGPNNYPSLGQSTGIDFPINDKEMLSVSTVFPQQYKEECLPVWEEFLQAIEIQTAIQ